MKFEVGGGRVKQILRCAKDEQSFNGSRVQLLGDRLTVGPETLNLFV